MLTDNVHLGVTARDLGTKIGRDDVPANFNLGIAAFAFEGFTFAADVQKIQHRSNVKAHLGAEYDYEFADNYFGAVRAGVNDGKFTVGAGLTVMGKYSLDYAYVTETGEFPRRESSRLLDAELLSEDCFEDRRPVPMERGVFVCQRTFDVSVLRSDRLPLRKGQFLLDFGEEKL